MGLPLDSTYKQHFLGRKFSTDNNAKAMVDVGSVDLDNFDTYQYMDASNHSWSKK